MTVSSVNKRNDYVGNGAVDTYSYGFKIFANTELLVTQRDTDDVETTLILTTDYTVTGVGDTTGGTIVLVAGNLTSDYALTIKRVLPLTQLTDIRNQGDSFQEILEDQYDRMLMIDLQQQDNIDRSLRLPKTTTGVDVVMPEPVALKLWRWNAAGTAIELVSTSDISGTITTVDTSLALASQELSVALPTLRVTAGGTVDALTATSSPSVGLTNGLRVQIELLGANATTTPTFNFNTTSAYTIVKKGNVALVAGDMPEAGMFVDLVYDLSATQWVLMNPANPEITTAIQQASPVGALTAYSGATAPTGWLLCYGQAVSRTTYSDLFAITSDTYGVGDGSTTFNLPDLRGRLPLGADNMGGASADRVTATEADNLGQSEGAEDHTLITSEMPAHTHEVNGDPNNLAGGNQATSNTSSTVNATGSTGGDGAHNNMQPYQTMNWIIKHAL